MERIEPKLPHFPLDPFVLPSVVPEIKNSRRRYHLRGFCLFVAFASFFHRIFVNSEDRMQNKRSVARNVCNISKMQERVKSK